MVAESGGLPRGALAVLDCFLRHNDTRLGKKTHLVPTLLRGLENDTITVETARRWAISLIAHLWAEQLQTDLLVSRNITDADEWRETWRHLHIVILWEDAGTSLFFTANPRFLRLLIVQIAIGEEKRGPRSGTIFHVRHDGFETAFSPEGKLCGPTTARPIQKMSRS